MDENQQINVQAPVVLDTSEKREKIAGCIINLKKGLKKMRRQDIDEAIAVLLMYDDDLKKKKTIPPRPIERHGIEYAMEPNIGTRSDTINAVIINENRKPVAYAIQRNIETTVNLAQNGKLQPLGDVIIEKWMKEHYPNEVSFMSLYATAASGHIEILEENIITVGSEVYVAGMKRKVTKLIGEKIWVSRGLMSMIPLKKSDVTPIEKVKVNYFKIDSWLK